MVISKTPFVVPESEIHFFEFCSYIRHTRPDPITNQNFKKKKKQAAAFHFLEAFCWLWRSFVDQRSEITRYHRAHDRALLYRTPRRLDEARDLGGA